MNIIMGNYEKCIPPGSFRDLITRHHAATWERGMITSSTTLNDFIEKLGEEYHETVNAYSNFALSGELVHESIDLCAVIINMLKYYGYDFIEEFRKNVEYQESRI